MAVVFLVSKVVLIFIEVYAAVVAPVGLGRGLRSHLQQLHLLDLEELEVLLYVRPELVLRGPWRARGLQGV